MSEPASEPQPNKRCNDCGVYKPVSEFHKRHSRAGGRVSYCKPCVSVRWKRWAHGESGRT